MSRIVFSYPSLTLTVERFAQSSNHFVSLNKLVPLAINERNLVGSPVLQGNRHDPYCRWEFDCILTAAELAVLDSLVFSQQSVYQALGDGAITLTDLAHTYTATEQGFNSRVAVTGGRIATRVFLSLGERNLYDGVDWRVQFTAEELP